MALKNKISLFDRNVGGVEGQPVGQNPPEGGHYFTDNGTTNSPFNSNDHLVSLLTKDVKGQFGVYGSSKEQDLDGVPGPQSQLGREAASKIHIDSLKLVPGGSNNSPFQDRGNGETPTQYLDGLPS